MMLITGADGFVGSALVEAVQRRGLISRAAVRSPKSSGPAFLSGADIVSIGSISGETDWTLALKGVDTIFHLAARTHVIREESLGALTKYRTVNVDGTGKLARDAVTQGVRRLVFLSSIKVNGERTFDRPFTENDTPKPEDAYGISKRETEQLLWEISAETGLEVVVLRAPLVYGPGVKGNFLRLLNLVAHGFPLPLASIHNKRSFVYLGNLVDALLVAMLSPDAAGRTYLVSDGEDLSTPDLIRNIAKALDVPPRLLPLPAWFVRTCAVIVGRKDEAARLASSLQVDSSKICRELGWRPPYSLAQGLEQTARWYLESKPGK